MGWIILLLLIGLPLMELSILIDVGADIGALPTIGLCLVTAAIGLNLVKAQGMQVMNRMQAKSEAGEAFGGEMIHGFFLLLAGLFLLFPGFMTDTVGALLLIPPVRLILGRFGIANIALKSKGNFGAHFHTSSNTHMDEGVIEAEFEDVTSNKDKNGTSNTNQTLEGPKPPDTP